MHRCQAAAVEGVGVLAVAAAAVSAGQPLLVSVLLVWKGKKGTESHTKKVQPVPGHVP